VFIEAKDDGGGGDNRNWTTGAINQHPVFYRPDALPVTQPTVSSTEGKNITFHVLAYLKLSWGSSSFVFGH